MLQPPLSHFPSPASELTRPFWDAAKDGRLIFQRCDECRRPFFRPEVACPHCLSRAWAWEDSAGKGALYSFSVMHRAPTPAFTAPFIFAAVELDEGFSMFSNLIGIETEAVRLDMRVEATFHPVSDDLVLPLFKPAEV